MIKINSMTDRSDGGLDLSLEMDYATLVQFAKIGILKVLVDASKEVVKDSSDLSDVIPNPCESNLAHIMCHGCFCWKSARAYSS